MPRRSKAPWSPGPISLQEMREQWSEDEFLAAVLGEARSLGWKACHFHDSRRQVSGGRMVGDADSAGWVDLVLVWRGEAADTSQDRVIYAELKRAKGGRLRPAQEGWLDALRRLASRQPELDQAVLWTPRDWPEIERVLREPLEAAQQVLPGHEARSGTKSGGSA